ncbi:MAG: S1 RNA-binding domain-containing protein, partial [Acidobacteria bacterium]|nr:S1 RNA-binding domain-containing protein [Acidobacteriota bacterium]
MDEQHNPSQQPAGTDEEAQQPQSAPALQTSDSRQPGETEEVNEVDAAKPAEPLPASQTAAETSQPSQQSPAAPAAPASPAAPAANAAEGRAHAAAEPAAGTAAEQPPSPERPAAGAAQPSAADPRGFAEILAEFEQGKGAARQAGGPGEAGETPGGTGAAAGSGAAGGGGVPATPNVGQKVSGKILSITGDQVFVDLGTKSEGMIEAAQLRNAEGQLTVNVGDSLDAIVTAIDPESGVIVLRKKASGGRGGHQEVAIELRQAFQYGMPVEGMVTGINKGGAEVQVYGMRAFCPLSQLDLRYVENPQQFIGQRLKFKVSRIEEGSRNRRPDIVLSRRALLEEEAQAKAAELRARLSVGAVFKGRVTSLTTYGAFIDLGGLEGLLHVSEIGYSRLADPREALSVGQEIEVQVIKIEKGKDEKRPERISLSRRALERDPWRDAADRFPEGTILT